MKSNIKRWGEMGGLHCEVLRGFGGDGYDLGGGCRQFFLMDGLYKVTNEASVDHGDDFLDCTACICTTFISLH